jgi:hypothetical protein
MTATIDKDGVVITEECTLTKDEAYIVAEFIDGNLYNYIRSDEEIDSMQWLRNVLHAYEKMCAASGYVGLTESENDHGCN